MIDFEKALTALADAQVRFVIVGGLAVTIHGSAYVTNDLNRTPRHWYKRALATETQRRRENKGKFNNHHMIFPSHLCVSVPLWLIFCPFIVWSDLDFCYARDAGNLSRLAQALQPYNPRLRGAPAGLPFRFDEQTLKSGLNFTLTTDMGDLDLLGEVTGIGDYAAAKAASMPVELFDHDFDVLTLDALIASKRAAGRPKDLLVLPELEALREATEE